MKRSGNAIRIGLVAALLAGCGDEGEPPTAGEVLREGVEMVLIDMRTFVTREGVRRARLEADTAEFMGENEIHLRPVSLTFFDELGRESSVITGDFGIFYELTEDMEAQGSVVVLDRRDDQRLETEELRYVRAEDRLYGDVPFILYSDGGRTRLEGSAFESDPSLDSFRVPSPTGSSERALPPPAPVGGEGEVPTAPPDSTALPDSSTTLPDSSTTLPDSSTVPVDSAPVPPDSTDTGLRDGAAARGPRG